MKNSLLLFLSLIFSLNVFSQASDLFFSEYVEGSSNNKYLEIFNGTGASVNLSDYQVLIFSNGNPDEAAPNYSETLGDIELLDGSVYTIGNASGAIFTADINSTVTYYNGDDAVVLKKISTGGYVDIIGRIGEDPGSAWTDGVHSTANKTLVRKAAVTGGITTNPASGFPTLVSEWTVYDTDYADNLGMHTFSTVTGTLTLTSPNGGESYTAGQSVQFAWNSTDVSNVYFEVWDDQSIWTPVSGLVASVDGTNTYDFTIPANAWTYNGYKLRVVDADNAAVNDESDNVFSITGHDTDLYWEGFEGSAFTASMEFSVLGASKMWTANSGYAQMNGYDNSAQEDEEDWLITNGVNFDNSTDELMEFYSSVNYDAAGSDLVLLYSTDYSGSGDPTSATWMSLSATFATSTTFTHSGYIDLSGLTGTVYFAFKYTSTATDADLWQVKDIYISGVDDSATAIEVKKEKTVKVVPNPFTTELRVEGDDVVSVALFNAAGQLVKDVPYAGTVSTADLNKGLYILQVKLADGTVNTQKVIKK